MSTAFFAWAEHRDPDVAAALRAFPHTHAMNLLFAAGMPSLQYADLPGDLQTLIEQILYEGSWGQPARIFAPYTRGALDHLVIPAMRVPIAPYLPWAERLEWDDRGPRQVARMADEMRNQGLADIAPIVLDVSGEDEHDELVPIDGRHRLLAAKQAGIETLWAITLPDILAAWAGGE